MVTRFLLEPKITPAIRLALLAGVILASAGLSYLLDGDQLSLLSMAILGILATIILLRWPPLGLVILMASSLVVRIEVSTGTQTRLNAAFLVLVVLIGLWIFHMLAHEKHFHLVESRTVRPLLGFAFVSVIAFGIGQLTWFLFAEKASIAAQAGGLAVFLFSCGAFLLMANQVSSLKWLKAVVAVFLAIGGLYIVAQLFQPLGLLMRNVFATGMSGSLFWVWLVSISFSQAVFNQRLHPVARFSLFAVLLATLYVSVGLRRDWTSGWLPSLVAVVVILWVSGSRWAWAATLVGAIAVGIKVQSVTGFLMGGDNTYSLMTRLEAWRIMAEIIKVSPVLGLGPANYYYYTPLYSILGYQVQFNSHNNYIDIVAQTGLLGLGFFLWFAWETARLGWRLRTQAEPGFAQAYVYGAVGGLAGMLAAGMLGDWVVPFIYNIGFQGFRASILGWLFLGGLVVLEQLVRKEQEAGSAP